MHIKYKKCCLRTVEENFEEFSHNTKQKDKEKHVFKRTIMTQR